MLGGADRGLAPTDLAAGLLELDGIEQLAAAIALVAAGVVVVAVGTRALHVAIGQEARAALAVGLLDRLLEKVLIPIESLKDFVSDGCLLGGGGASKDVGADAEPVVNVGVQLVILCT